GYVQDDHDQADGHRMCGLPPARPSQARETSVLTKAFLAVLAAILGALSMALSASPAFAAGTDCLTTSYVDGGPLTVSSSTVTITDIPAQSATDHEKWVVTDKHLAGFQPVTVTVKINGSKDIFSTA